MDEQQDMMMRMLELTAQGYACSQILLLLAMELSGEENSGVVRTMAALNEGMCGTGRLCGKRLRCRRTGTSGVSQNGGGFFRLV